MPPNISRCFDIGGPEILTYREMMVYYAQVAALKPRRILSLPLVSPSLSSHWVRPITPVPKKIARPLMESLINEVVCKENGIATYIPAPEEDLTGFQRAVELALKRIQDRRVRTRWASAADKS